MGKHEGLPVLGYKPQTDTRVELVNGNKQIEERALRLLEMQAPWADPLWSAIARTHLEMGFMAMNRAIFQPERVKLPEDELREMLKGTLLEPGSKAAIPSITVYALSWGGSDVPMETRYFRPEEQCDAFVRASEKIVDLDRGPGSAAFVSLVQLPDAQSLEARSLISWTKTSDERPTAEGSIEIPK